MDAVRPGEHALAPGAQEVAVVVENRHRMVAPVEGIDVVVAVDPDRGAIAEHDLVRDLRPALLDLETPLAAAKRHSHGRPPSSRISGIIDPRRPPATPLLSSRRKPGSTGQPASWRHDGSRPSPG